MVQSPKLGKILELYHNHQEHAIRDNRIPSALIWHEEWVKTVLSSRRKF